jgi:putative FmdB family regulatory protein
MPTYEYECNSCHHRFDARQGFNDEPVAICPKCKGSSQRVFHAVPIVFKGSGFYCTDHGHGNRYDSPPKADKETDKKEATTDTKKEPKKKGGNGKSQEGSKESSTTAEKKTAASKVESTSSKS